MKLKAYDKIRKVIQDVKSIDFDNKYCALGIYHENRKFDEIELLPYWRTIQTLEGDVELYQGDIIQLNKKRYIVRYFEKNACFSLLSTDFIGQKSAIYFAPITDWWYINEAYIVYLGNEHTNPELLEEK